MRHVDGYGVPVDEIYLVSKFITNFYEVDKKGGL